MLALSTTTSTNSWVTPEWLITSGHGVELVDIPPPSTDDTFGNELPPLGMPVTDKLDLPDRVGYTEFIEDLALAEEAESEYQSWGITKTIAYTEYRNQRLGTKPPV